MSNCAASSQALKCVVDAKDLPLCCPLPGKILWSAHPRVYLALSDSGLAVCPYCNTQYQLTPSTAQ